MKATKEELIEFLETNVLRPAENHPLADKKIKRKVNCTRMRLNKQVSAEKVEEFFWSAMATDNGIDSYHAMKVVGCTTFEDVREQFKNLCSR